MSGLLARLRALIGRRAADLALADEIAFHVAMETEKNIALGMSADEARRRALVAFGGRLRAREEHREVRGIPRLEEVAADARFALRTLVRSPVLAGAAIVTLALGVGANTAIFSAVNAVILRPLPFPNPDRLWMLAEENPERGWHLQTAAPANYLDWKEQVPAFQDVASYTDEFSRETLTGQGAPRIVRTAAVTGNFFSVLGVSAERGRILRDEETWKGAAPVVVIGHRLWQTVFAGDPAIIGRSIRLDGSDAQIVGVMPEGFAFPSSDFDLWKPFAFDRADREKPFFRRAHWLRVIARLRPGATSEQANAQFQSVVHRLQTQFPLTNRTMGGSATPLHDFLVGDTRLPLLVLLGSVALLLLIACANVGNLLLVQAAGREREASLRLALGAGRARLIRQALTESMLLSALGGGAGLGLGWWGTRALASLQPAGMLRTTEIGVDWSVLAFVVGITTVSGLLFGIAPALWNARRAPAEALRAGGRSGSDGRRMRRWGDALVIGEVALALMLTVGAGLLARSFWKLEHVYPGFDSHGVLAMQINLTGPRYDSIAQLTRFDDDLVERLKAVPGVESAGMTSQLPLSGSGWTSDFSVQGRPPGDFGTEVEHRRSSVDYFRTMRVPVLRGRAFTEADIRGAAPVVIINDALARSYFKDQDPIGQHITNDRSPDSTSRWRTIVGVVGNEHQLGLGRAAPTQIISPLAQEQSQSIAVVVRTSGDPVALAPAMRRVVAAIDPNLAIISLRSMDDVRSESLGRDRFVMTLLVVFAGVGLALAVVGVYGVLAQLTRRRTREMGIRIALGAQAAQVSWLVVGHGLRLTGAGLALGAAAALVATRAMATMLYQVPANDAATFGAVGLILAATSLVAAWLPARRASRADPAAALRAD